MPPGVFGTSRWGGCEENQTQRISLQATDLVHRSNRAEMLQRRIILRDTLLRLLRPGITLALCNRLLQHREHLCLSCDVLPALKKFPVAHLVQLLRRLRLGRSGVCLCVGGTRDVLEKVRRALPTLALEEATNSPEDFSFRAHRVVLELVCGHASRQNIRHIPGLVGPGGHYILCCLERDIHPVELESISVWYPWLVPRGRPVSPMMAQFQDRRRT